ncbi:ABC transporter permease [Microbacterium keratanolyticum]|uniref:ABC transporter permease n=1 Tax=Microbacterium keratanolyticum TaxID=67574 RepID=UPI00362DB0E9
MTSTTIAPVAAAPRASAIQIALRFALLIGLLAVVLYFSLASSLFLTPGNIKNILISSSVLLIIAVPQAVLVIMGYVDMSVGSIVGLAGVAMGVQIVDNGWNPWAAMGLAILIGALAGLINGFLIAYTRLSPIIVTLGTLQLYRGITEGWRQNPPAGFGETVGMFGRGSLFGIPLAVLISLLVFAVGALFLYRMAAGRHVYAIGVNDEAAFLSGLRTKRLPLLFYILIGAAAGIGGILLAARLDSAPPTTLGANLELNVLTAVLLGGIAFTGGRGTMLGVLLGVLFLTVLSNGMTLTNVPYWAQSIATGGALVIAAGLDELSQKRGTVRRLTATRG